MANNNSSRDKEQKFSGRDAGQHQSNSQRNSINNSEQGDSIDNQPYSHRRLSEQKSLDIEHDFNALQQGPNTLDKSNPSTPKSKGENKYYKNQFKTSKRRQNNKEQRKTLLEGLTNGNSDQVESVNGHQHTTNHMQYKQQDTGQKIYGAFQGTERAINDISASFQSEYIEQENKTLFQSSKRIAIETKKIFAMAVPASVQQSVQYISKMATISIIGHHIGFGANEMAAASLGFTFINVTGMSVLLGLSSALDTFANQSYTGNRKMTGVYLQRCIVISFFVSIIIAVLWSFSGSIFLLLRIDPVVCSLVQIYVSYSIIGLIPNVIFAGVQKFLYAQGIFTPVFFIQLFLLPLYCGSQYYFVNYTAMEFTGAPIALALCDWLYAIVLVIYARYINGYEAWGGFTWRAFEGLWEYFSLGIFSVLQICSEWWAYEICTIEAGWISVDFLAAQSVLASTSNFIYTIFSGVSVAAAVVVGNNLGSRQPGQARIASNIVLIVGLGWISVDSLASQSVLTTTSSFMYNVFIGVAIAASVQVGNYLGAKDPGQAKLSANLCMIFALGVGLLLAIVLGIFRYQWADLFTQEKHIIDIIVTMLPISLIGGIFDSVQTSGAGILRGAGYQSFGAFVNSICWYLIGIPLGYILAFHFRGGIGLTGIWIGIAISMFLQSIVYVPYLYLFINWDKAAYQAQRRTRKVSSLEASLEAANSFFSTQRISSTEDLSQGLLDEERNGNTV